jgi:hypothetical protein
VRPLRCFRQLYIACSVARELSALLFHLPSSLFRVPAPALRRDTIIIGGGATNRGVETSVREAFNLDLACVDARMLLEQRCGRPRL